jgi:hypothetical protein
MKQGQVTVRVVDTTREDGSLSIENLLKSLPTLRGATAFRGDLLEGGRVRTRRLPKVKGYRFQWLHFDRAQPEVVTVGYVRKLEGD